MFLSFCIHNFLSNLFLLFTVSKRVSKLTLYSSFRANLRTFYNAIYMLGMLFGSFLFGWISDHHGRLNSLLLAVITVSLSGFFGYNLERIKGCPIKTAIFFFTTKISLIRTNQSMNLLNTDLLFSQISNLVLFAYLITIKSPTN